MAISEMAEPISNNNSAKDMSADYSNGISTLRFLKTPDRSLVSCYPLLSIDRALEEAGVESLSNNLGKSTLFVAKVLSRLNLMRNLRRSKPFPARIFVGFMGYSLKNKTFPFSYWNELVPYCFDCWPNTYERWAAFFQRHRVRIAFFTARQSAQYFARLLPDMHSIWLPEATDPLDYCSSRSWAERDIDVLELGRKNDAYHEKIAAQLAKANRTHYFEKVKGEIIFPDRSDLLDGFARTKLSICFPSSQTHPERSGSVETVTHRYFESMASKCLIVGHAPQELVDLFGFNPVVEVQPGSEFEQIESLLNYPEGFHRVVERNYERLLEVGTWRSRIATILEAVASLRAEH